MAGSNPLTQLQRNWKRMPSSARSTLLLGTFLVVTLILAVIYVQVKQNLAPSADRGRNVCETKGNRAACSAYESACVWRESGNGGLGGCVRREGGGDAGQGTQQTTNTGSREQQCSYKGRVQVSTDNQTFTTLSTGDGATTYRLPAGTTQFYIRGINPKTNAVDPRVTVRMVWNERRKKGAVCVNKSCAVNVADAKESPMVFEAFQNEGTGSGPEQLYWNEKCMTRGKVKVEATKTATVRDEFNGSSLDTNIWEKQGVGTVTVSGGTLNFSTPATTTTSNGSLVMLKNGPGARDFDAYITINSFNFDRGTDDQKVSTMELKMYGNDQNLYIARWVKGAPTTASYVDFIYKDNDQYVDGGNTSTAENGPVTLHIRRRGTTLEAFGKVAGSSSETLLGTKNMTYTGNLIPFLVNFIPNIGSPGATVSLDNFSATY